MGILLTAFLSGVVFWFWRYVKSKTGTIRAEGFYTKGIVVDYQPAPFELGGDWTGIYPYVEYVDSDQQQKKGMLKYPVRYAEPFKIGAEIEIIKHNGILYHRNSLH
ncbi:hypothetical protein [Cesiribacter sp. SM1]|uniref:hypothetical protein n=1 Tax=Cesiribacter sp. SM1 TaxID=2861196 RepID=UPI001CD42114|nr:hypothetical protein [Cesiribacter sp. SM1]